MGWVSLAERTTSARVPGFLLETTFYAPSRALEGSSLESPEPQHDLARPSAWSRRFAIGGPRRVAGAGPSGGAGRCGGHRLSYPRRQRRHASGDGATHDGRDGRRPGRIGPGAAGVVQLGFGSPGRSAEPASELRHGPVQPAQSRAGLDAGAAERPASDRQRGDGHRRLLVRGHQLAGSADRPAARGRAEGRRLGDLRVRRGRGRGQRRDTPGRGSAGGPRALRRRRRIGRDSAGGDRRRRGAGRAAGAGGVVLPSVVARLGRSRLHPGGDLQPGAVDRSDQLRPAGLLLPPQHRRLCAGSGLQ